MKEVQWIDPDFLAPKDAWDRLSMKEKAAMMKVAVQNGITNLSDIRAKYNEFAEGGPVDTDWSYNSWKRQVAEHKGIRPDEDNTYDYEAYFNKYPEEAWKMLKGDPAAHFSDEFKTVYHPTFSSKSIGNDGSIYSGVRNPKTNPQGLIGGTWSPDYHTFTMSPDGYKGPVSMDDRKWYLENAEDSGVVLREADGSLPIYDGIPWGGVLPNVTVYGNKHAEGGNLYKGGGSIVSDKLVDMTIEEEGFNKQPEDIGDGKMTLGSGLTASKWHNLYRKRGNKWSAADNRMAVRQELSDRERWARSNVPNWDNLPDSSKEALLMYKYNYDFNRANSPKLFAALEAGNLPEAARQMDATSKDPKFKKGLTNRRKREQAHFMLGVRPTPTAPNDITLQSPDNTFVYNPYLLQQQNTTMLPQVVPDEDAYVSTHEVSPEEIKAQKLQESFDNINRFNRTMELLGNNLRIPTFHPTTGNDVLDLLWYTRGNDSPLLQMADEYARGGKIHIKEKNRGKFTRLKERTGKSASWFKAHGTPAQKKMAVFALNSRKWKHGLGGNLFSGEEDHSSQMNIGLNATNGWHPYTLGDIVANGERVARQRKALQDTFLNFPVESNDATVVSGGRPQNTHLEGKAIRGGMDNAAWEKEHPGLAQLGYAASAIPFAVASAPLLGAAAETGAGQAVTAGLGWLGDAAVSSPLFTNAASRALGTSTLLPWLDAGMTAGFGAHGIQETAEGNFTPMTALEVAPLGRLAKPIYEGVIEPGMRFWNSPLTGNWTKFGSKEYRLSPNSLGNTGLPLESRSVDASTETSPGLFKSYGIVLPRFIDKVKSFNGAYKGKRAIDAALNIFKPSYAKTLAKSPELIEHIPLYRFGEFSPKQISDFQKVWSTEASLGPYSTEGMLQYATTPDKISELPSLFADARQLQSDINLASRYGRFIGNRYNSMMREITDPTLRHIAEESPQYTTEVLQQQKNAGAATEDFVKDLVQKANDYRRFMREPHTAEQFGKFEGSGIQVSKPQINVESRWRSDFNGEYGSYGAYYQGQPTLKGDMSTWWDQRVPEGVQAIKGMHTKTMPSVQKAITTRIPTESGKGSHHLPVRDAFFKSYYETGAPSGFINWPVHQIFIGERGTSLPNFKISLLEDGIPEGFKWSKGYGHGGNLFDSIKV